VRSIAVPICALLACLAFFATGASVASAKADKATVTAVQEKLGVPADGVMGPQTRKALRRFQRANGLTVDGVIGPQTLEALGIRAHSAAKRKRSMTPEALLEKIARCESGGDPTAVSPNGRYRGKYQFSRATWRSMGGHGDPARAPEAVQDRIAARLYRQAGTSPWPVCGG
jgi:peptidoglycan hydrolase-like protein with peptidoglycan-binding domain